MNGTPDLSGKVAAVTRGEANAAFARRVDPGAFTVVSAGTFGSVNRKT